MMLTKDKVRGAFLGIAIGDALGKPVETLSAETIKERHGEVNEYLSCSGHKWFNGHMQGTWTDDTQLSLAIARAFINKGEFDLDEIAKEHVNEFVTDVKGWGGSTREAISKIATGTHWSKASITEKANRGVGNGVAMKVAPISVYMALTNPACEQEKWKRDLQKIVQVATMTHRTSMAITSGLAHTFAVYKCLISTPDNFDRPSLIRTICGAGMIGRQQLPETIESDDIANRFDMLHDYENVGTEEIINRFGGGSCYVYDSLPFTYMFFLRNPYTIQSLYDCVSAGGDTDSNGSMLACMLGALHGPDIFPQNLVDGLDQKEMILETADKLYEKFANESK
jgi:ADP-ribosyl-[dinitrogen reductase] hydrolase